MPAQVLSLLCQVNNGKERQVDKLATSLRLAVSGCLEVRQKMMTEIVHQDKALRPASAPVEHEYGKHSIAI